MEGGKRFFMMLLVVVLALGCGFGGGILAGGYQQSKANTATEQPADNSQVGKNTENAGYTVTPSQENNTTTQIQIVGTDTTVGETIAEKVLPSVVGIDTIYETSYGSTWYFGFGRDRTMEAESQGTGFVVDEAGYILTNSHVVNDGNYKTVTIYLYDGRELEGKVLWNDSTLDLAIVKIEADGLVAAELGDSDELKVGSYAAALGNPLGLQFKFSMSQGIISGLDRTIEVSSGTGTAATTMENLIQTDATINSGNSGGPLVNSKGQVIGINSAKATEGESMGFAIPINDAKPVVEQIKDTGTFTRAYLGIKGIGLEESSSYSAESFKERYGTSSGIYISEVTLGSGAEQAGLQKGDIITAVEGVEVRTMNKINTLLIAYKDGERVEVTYIREGETYTTEVMLTSDLN